MVRYFAHVLARYVIVDIDKVFVAFRML